MPSSSELNCPFFNKNNLKALSDLTYKTYACVVRKGFFYIIIFNTSIEILAGIPRQTQARIVYQFTARLTPVSRPSEFTASRAAKP